MYRSRPYGNLDNNALSFLSSLDEDKHLFFYDIIGSQAHVIMLYECGIITKKEVQEILVGLDKLLKNSNLLKEHGDVNSEDIHELVESVIIKITGINFGGKMHTARSRNDQVILDIRMKTRDDINNICEKIIFLCQSLIKQAEKNMDSIMPLYTHLQQAQLGVLSHYLISYCYSLLRDFDRYFEMYERINSSPLGACAIGGSSIKIDRDKVSDILGFSGLIYNSIDATSSRDSLLEFASNSLICMLNLSKIAEDLILWSTTEFGFISLDDRFSSTSSVMPQKKNPDPLEIIRGKTGVMSGLFQSISSIMKGLPSGYCRDLQEIKPSLWKMSLTISSSLVIMEGIIGTLNVDTERMHSVSTDSYAISLDLAEQLIKKNNIPFRTSHKLIGNLVDIASKRGNISLTLLNMNDISLILKKSEFQNYDLTADDLYDLIHNMTPENSISNRITKGSPNKSEQQQMLYYLHKKIKDSEIKLNYRKAYLIDKFKELDAKIIKLINEP